LAAGIAISASSWCHAKITPAALQRGKFRARWREGAVRNSKFELIDFRLGIAGSAMRTVKTPGVAAS
jgi:hypothetical protein